MSWNLRFGAPKERRGEGGGTINFVVLEPYLYGVYVC